ncbi:MAG: SCO family protein [Myxococcales bacterium]|nr:SCO family protein [Myxococcales bacterium]
MTAQRSPSFRTLVLTALAAAALAAALGGLAWQRFGGASRTPPVLGELPRFAFVERSGSPFGTDELAGKIWVADFIFTNCRGPCPAMTAQMRTLQDALRNVKDLRLLSFSIDPERDTLEVLRAYADRFGADRERWVFLRGDRAAVHALSVEGFHLGVGEVDEKDRKPGEDTLFHSQRFILVDGKGRVRGYYDIADADFKARLVADVTALARERARG